MDAPAGTPSPDPASEDDEDTGLFGTATMAELCARQGRLGQAIAIYTRLIAGAAADEQRSVWMERLAALSRAHGGASAVRVAPAHESSTAAPTAPALPPTARAATEPARVASEPAPPAGKTPAASAQVVPALAAPAHRLALVVRQPVRGGQVVHAEGNDVVVLAPVNPGGQVVADGHVHVYAPLRGRAIAGAAGCPDARIFCQRLEAELLAINGVYLTADEIPAAAWGRPAQISLQDGRWVIAPL
jgi:septum site-determining protein MinC